MEQIVIRHLNEEEYHLLEEFLYQAIFQRQGEPLLSRSIIQQPDIQVFIRDFGKADDFCLAADVDGQVVGAVWTRILNGKDGQPKGFGSVDEITPEFAISLLPQWRGKGIGSRLMKAMLDLLRENGCEKASLAVQKDNYAIKMYEKCGFTIIDENDEEYIMVCRLKL